MSKTSEGCGEAPLVTLSCSCCHSCCPCPCEWSTRNARRMCPVFMPALRRSTSLASCFAYQYQETKNVYTYVRTRYDIYQVSDFANIAVSVVRQAESSTRRTTTDTRTGDPYAGAKHFALCTQRRHTQALMHVQSDDRRLGVGTTRTYVRGLSFKCEHQDRRLWIRWCAKHVVQTWLDCGCTRGWARTHTRARRKIDAVTLWLSAPTLSGRPRRGLYLRPVLLLSTD